MPPIAITSRRMEEFAGALLAAKEQRSLPPERFQQLHAAFVGVDAAGVRWTVGLKTRIWNRLADDHWVSDQAPSELFLDSETVFALEAIGKTEPAPPPPLAPASRPSESRPPAMERAPMMPLRMAIEDDWAPVWLCVGLTGLFAVLGWVRQSTIAYGAAGLFALLVLILIVMNMTARRV